MILVESSAGDNAIYACFVLDKGSAPRYEELPSGFQGMDPIPFIEVSKPFACAMPPPGSSSAWMPVDPQGFGPVAQEMEVGTLASVQSYPYVPKPCYHSTLSGAIAYTGTDAPPAFGFRSKKDYPSNGTRYFGPDGQARHMFQGRPFSTSISGYDRFGKLQPGTIKTGTQQFWAKMYLYSPLAFTTARHGRYAPSSPGAYESDMTWYYPLDRTFSTENWNTYRAVDHTSLTTWTETWITELHHDFGSIVESDLSTYSGAPFCYMSIRRERKYTMTHIRSEYPTVFTGRFSVEESVYWRNVNPDYHSHVTTSGTKRFYYTFDTPLLSMEPGSAKGSLPDRKSFDALCARFQPTVLSWYRDDMMTSARESAYQDTTGLQANWLENLSSIGGITQVLLPLLEGYRAVKSKNPVAAKDALKGAYLTWLYVIKPSITDAKEVINKKNTLKQASRLTRYAERRRGATHDEAVITDYDFVTSGPYLERSVLRDYYCTLHLAPRGNPVARVWGALESLGLSPDLGNDWDMLPFSFVADWFVSIGDALKNMSAWSNAVISCNIKHRIETARTSTPCMEQDLEDLDLTGCQIITPLDYVQYDRRLLTGYGEISPAFFDTTTGLTPSQVAQGVALIG